MINCLAFLDFHGQHSHVILEYKQTSSNMKLHGMLDTIGTNDATNTMWISPAAEATDGLEGWDITCFGMILQPSHVILFCHGTCQLIVLGGMSRPQWGLLTCELVLSHSIHRVI